FRYRAISLCVIGPSSPRSYNNFVTRSRAHLTSASNRRRRCSSHFGGLPDELAGGLSDELAAGTSNKISARVRKRSDPSSGSFGSSLNSLKAFRSDASIGRSDKVSARSAAIRRPHTSL